MNMIKKTGGFTLVELIVVIAILAILAGVAVPAYAGYITKAKEANDYTQLDSMKTAIAYAVMEEDPSATLETATVTFGATGTNGTFKVVANNDDITDYITTDFFPNGLESKSGATTATLADGEWDLNK